MGCEIQPYSSQPTKGNINKRSHPNQAEDDGVECSGKACQSCTARVIADCVAVCCCPCAVVNFFTLALFKLPWMMGRRYLSKKKKKKKLKNEGKDGISRKDQGENGNLGKVTAVEGKDEDDELGSGKYSARFEAERVWLELYRVDNLGFGRVSFSGIQSLG
ncbi:uncharacterized protein LOC143560834 [Bidens hawaiensis]|uniref:uncharacterized protein LOC143560834 n=1 Tax=Bidens hawaiensis TaxID=980011 RepID=UPI0040494DC9